MVLGGTKALKFDNARLDAGDRADIFVFSLSPSYRLRLPLAPPFHVDNETLACDPIVRLKLLHDVSSVLSTEVHVARSHC